ncbi:DUF1190 domain-containing protein [Methylocystis sp. H4A]|uniref:DUF1190 domain-containing protein n=1 Tax=Methylocystis sp. H4A TaxID=2785788 RepID=UPI0018C28434|nr:DUF1190 domain-containing protein [Methylocystis sp. H4A]MBG0800753.1 DUF1190 domain-containing protein [Methylocystis sp. H4A]
MWDSKNSNTATLQSGAVAALRYVAFCLSFVAPACAETMGKTYFFATQDACIASGAFTRRECVAAFTNAREQLLDKAPRFSASAECQLHFRICEPTYAEPSIEEPLSYAPSEESSYMPSELGVEIIASPRGVEAAPTLAVDTPHAIFAYFPVSRSYNSDDRSVQEKALQDKAAILSPDRFIPFAKHKAFTGEVTFVAAALGAIEGPIGDDVSATEPREQRRLRLRNAPFIP